MRIKINGATRGGIQAIPDNEAAILGFLADGLVGLFTLDDGEGATYGGPWTNHANLAVPGVLHGSGYVAPTKIAAGLRVSNADGFAIDTGISAAQTAFTAVIAANVNAAHAAADAGISNLEHLVFGTTTGVHSLPNGVHSNAQTAIGFSIPNDGRVFFRDPNLWASSNGRWYLLPAAGLPGDAVVMACVIDGPGETVRLSTLASTSGNGKDADDGGDIAGNFDGTQTGNFTIGAWGGGLARPVTLPAIDIYGAAIWDRALNGSETLGAMGAMSRLLASKGITAFEG